MVGAGALGPPFEPGSPRSPLAPGWCVGRAVIDFSPAEGLSSGYRENSRCKLKWDELDEKSRTWSIPAVRSETSARSSNAAAPKRLGG
jgi:hypothetical protein